MPLTGALIAVALRRRHHVQAVWSLGVMVASLVSSGVLLAVVWSTGQPVIFQAGGWLAPYGITFVADLLSATFVLMAQIVLVLGVVYALGSKEHAMQYPLFYTLFLTLTTGLTGALLTGDVFSLFVFAELLVISGAVLTAISDDRHGVEAAYKYFFISLLASILLLIAIGCLYASYGTLNMADLALRIAANPDPPLLPMAAACLLTAFMVKGAIFPFHFWQPDFHSASPTPVSAMLSSVVVKLGIYGLLRMTTLLFVPFAPVLCTVLLLAGIVGVGFGGLAANGTHHAKRMLAYSTIAQLGFICVAIGWSTALALTAAIVSAFNHSLAKSALLMLAGSVASRASIKSASFSVITGLGKYLPAAGVLFFLGALALAGLPPLNGFVSKALLFQSGLSAERYETLLLIGVMSVLTLVYMFRAFMRIWWEPIGDDVKPKPYGDRLVAPAILVGLCLLLGLYAEPLINLAQATAQWMLTPQAYIQAVLGG
jgi:multicomponent Na+:H+ antiporter subunit D